VHYKPVNTTELTTIHPTSAVFNKEAHFWLIFYEFSQKNLANLKHTNTSMSSTMAGAQWKVQRRKGGVSWPGGGASSMRGWGRHGQAVWRVRGLLHIEDEH
jgi:hypothetical protein